MNKLTIEVNKIADKKPKDGQECWVLASHNNYFIPTAQVYNAHYECWDDATGDDYDFDVSEDDLWMPLPSSEEMKG